MQSWPAGDKLGQKRSAVRAWEQQGATLLLQARRAAEKARALHEIEMQQKRAERKANRTARTARNVLGQARRAAKCASKRIMADVLARQTAGLVTVGRDQIAAELLDLAREIANLGRELSACSSDLLSAVDVLPASSRPRRGGAATSCATTGCASRKRTKWGASSSKEDDLRARLRMLLAHKRSMRTSVGRRPAVFRRTTLRGRHMALARELFKPTAAPLPEAGTRSVCLAQSEVVEPRRLRTQLGAIFIGGIIIGGISDDGCVAGTGVRSERKSVRRAHVSTATSSFPFEISDMM